MRVYNGLNSRWYNAAESGTRHRRRYDEGSRLHQLEEAAINDLIDDAYRAKYQGSPYLGPMIGACAATVKVMPRQTDQ